MNPPRPEESSVPTFEALVDAARAVWPSVEAPEAAFRRHLHRHQPPPLHAPDLYLACACAEGVPSGVGELERMLRSPSLRDALRRFEASGARVSDIIDRLREKLLVTMPGGEPKIAMYAGRAPLEAWLRAAAVRTAVDMVKRQRPVGSLDQIEELTLQSVDPELALLRDQHGNTFRQALRSAVSELNDRDVNVLRLHFLDGLNIDRIGVAYGVHRATVARWLVSARKALLEGVRQRLASELRLTDEQAQSLIRALRSGFQASIGAWLAERPAPP